MVVLSGIILGGERLYHHDTVYLVILVIIKFGNLHKIRL